MTYSDFNARRAAGGMAAGAEIDAGLRAYMQRVYSYMAGGLALTGIVAYAAAVSGFYQTIAGTFGAMSLYGYTTGTDLSRFGSFLLMGLIGIVIASLVNIFIGSSALQFAISIVGVIVFVGLTAYDTQRIKGMYLESDAGEIADKKAVLGALALYLDFINLFMMLLQLFGQRREN
jgi:FtsH-binding integral membrane protein